MDAYEKIINIADRNQIEIHEFDTRDRDGLAFCDVSGQMAVAIHPRVVRGEKAHAARVIGHEVGHCITGSFYAKKLTLPNIGQCERRASKWYICTAVKKEELQRALKESDDDYWGAAEALGVDIETIIEACDHYFDVDPAAIRARLGRKDR